MDMMVKLKFYCQLIKIINFISLGYEDHASPFTPSCCHENHSSLHCSFP